MKLAPNYFQFSWLDLPQATELVLKAFKFPGIHSNDEARKKKESRGKVSLVLWKMKTRAAVV